MGFFFRILVFLALATPGTTLGQAQLEVQLNLPDRLPPLATIRPGVQVARDLDQEVFFVNGRYWVRRDERWHGARAPRGPWAYVEPGRVPPEFAQSPPGHRRWRGDESEQQGRGGDREHGRHEQDRGQR